MWFNKQQLGKLTTAILDKYETDIRDWKTRHDARLQDVETLEQENRALRDRLIAAEGQKRAAMAMNDLLTVQINQAQNERGQFLQKLVDPSYKPEIAIPKISKNPTLMPPGVDFEDMGDARSTHEGQADTFALDPLDEPTPGAQTITELLGQVYDPASELGADQPHLGDDPAILTDV